MTSVAVIAHRKKVIGGGLDHLRRALAAEGIDALAATGVALAIVPAGTANLLATNLGVPKDLEAAIDVGLYGVRRPLDVGRVNGERFAVKDEASRDPGGTCGDPAVRPGTGGTVSTIALAP